MVAIPFPKVPTIPGVPALNVQPGAPPFAPEAPRLFRDSLSASSAKAGWGIYDTAGALALDPDSIAAFEIMREFRVPDFPVEAGGFASYNKVATPAEIRVTVTKGGSDADRLAFLDTVKALVESLDLFDIVTPDSTFSKRNITRYDYRRTSDRGATLLTVELTATEIREAGKAAFTNSKAASGATPAVGGPVRPSAATAAQLPPAAATPSTPAIGALPGISAGDTTTAKLGKIDALAQAGATVADMVAKGVGFQSVPMLDTAAQSISTTLGGQPVKLDLAQKATGLFVNVFVNDALVIGGVLARNDAPLVRSSYLDFAGELYFRDTNGSADPAAALLGRFALLYAGA